MKSLSTDPYSPSRWFAFLIAGLLVAARMLDPWAGIIALGLALAQLIYLYLRDNSWDSLSVQVSIVLVGIVFTGHLPHLGPLLWIPATGAALRALFGYCLATRLLSLRQPHRTEPLSWSLLRRTFTGTLSATSPSLSRLQLRTTSPLP